MTKLPKLIKFPPFIRISWQEAEEVLQSALHDKYGAKGKIEFKKDRGYDGIGDHYDMPDLVDIFLKES